MVKQYFTNGNLWTTIKGLILVGSLIVSISVGSMAVVGYDRFVSKEEYRCDQIELSSQLKEIRADIKVILRTLR